MLVLGTCTRAVGAEAETLRSRLAASVQPGLDQILIRAGSGLCSVYNQILESASEQADCEAVVLLHDDTYILDPNFRAKILSAFRSDPSLGIVGVVGASRIPSLAWWESAAKVGEVYESRGFIDFGSPRGPVDVVDGLLMVLGRNVFTRIRFDERTFPGFHGYDIDYCLQVRAAGFSCRVIPMEILHKTKGGLGNQDEFLRASLAMAAKWARSKAAAGHPPGAER